jgi:hypothetical protein
MIRPIFFTTQIFLVIYQDKITLCMWLIGLVGYLSYEFKKKIMKTKQHKLINGRWVIKKHLRCITS